MTYFNNLVENCCGLIKALSLFFAVTYGEKSITFLMGTSLFQTEFRKWYTPITPSQGYHYISLFDGYIRFLNTWNVHILGTHYRLYMKGRDCLIHLVIILETIVRRVIICFSFFTDLDNIIYIYIYIYLLVYLATVTLQRLDFIGVCSVLTHYERMYQYTSYFRLNHNVWCIGLHLSHTKKEI
jgi:hypothetical protein